MVWQHRGCAQQPPAGIIEDALLAAHRMCTAPKHRSYHRSSFAWLAGSTEHVHSADQWTLASLLVQCWQRSGCAQQLTDGVCNMTCWQHRGCARHVRPAGQFGTDRSVVCWQCRECAQQPSMANLNEVCLQHRDVHSTNTAELNGLEFGIPPVLK